jgi:hypothetical protein
VEELGVANEQHARRAQPAVDCLRVLVIGAREQVLRGESTAGTIGSIRSMMRGTTWIGETGSRKRRISFRACGS